VANNENVTLTDLSISRVRRIYWFTGELLHQTKAWHCVLWHTH